MFRNTIIYQIILIILVFLFGCATGNDGPGTSQNNKVKLEEDTVKRDIGGYEYVIAFREFQEKKFDKALETLTKGENEIIVLDYVKKLIRL